GGVEGMIGAQLEHAVDQSVVVATAGVRLDRHGHDLKRVAEIGQEAVRQGRVRVGVQQSEASLEYRGWPGETGARQVGGDPTAVRRPTGVQTLGPGAVRKIFE